MICPNKQKQKEMKKELGDLLDWETSIARGVDYTLDLYAGSLSSVLFKELTRTTKGGKGMSLDPFPTSDWDA